MNKELHSYRRFTTKSEVDKAFHTLEGILKGINIDNEIDQKEINELKNWFGTHYDLIDRKPLDEIIPFILKITDDNKVTKEEYDDLKWICKNITTSNKYYDFVSSDIQRLHGILHGIMADNIITKEELEGLQNWIEDHTDMIGAYPYDEIEALLYKVLDDGIVSDEEQNMLKAYFSQFIELNQSCIDCDSINELRKEIILPAICTMNPDIIFNGSLFCFTGISSKGSRSLIEDQIANLNGKYKDTILKDTNYLIVGDKNNPCWAFSCYGRKVEKAIDLRKSGNNIQIVKEIDFWDAVIQ